MSYLPRRALGATGIMVSRVGVGTGTSGFTGVMTQAAIAPEAFGDILAYGLEAHGVNLWDTAHTYDMYPHLRAGLARVARSEVVIIGKTCAATKKGAVREVEAALRAMGTDYLDIFMLHGVRNATEFRCKRGALEGLLRLKEQGGIRAIGLSAHGIGGVRAALASPEIEIAFVRMNYAGACMDSPQEGLAATLAGLPAVRQAARTLIPKCLVPSLSGMIEPACAPECHQETVFDLVARLSAAGKGVLGMKLFGAGKLTAEPDKVLAFARTRDEVDAFVLGIEKKEELDSAAAVFRADPSRKNNTLHPL